MKEYFGGETATNGKYLVVSDIHGRDQQLEQELRKLARETFPKIVFFLGDIVGTERLDKLQKLFYNGVYNHAKKALKENPNISDIELLSYPISEDRILADGGQEIWEFLYEEPNIDAINNATLIRELASYAHFGHFCSCLPKKIRQSLRKDMKVNAQIWINIMDLFAEKGSLITITEGNWDARTPLDFYPDKTKCRALPPSRRRFRLKQFIEENSKYPILYFDKVGHINDGNNIFVFWPFDSAVKTTQIPELEDDKNIILISHAQISWGEIKNDTIMTSEGQKINQNMPMVVQDLKANFVVHGHLHDKIKIGSQPISGYIFNHQTFVYYLPLRTFRFIDF